MSLEIWLTSIGSMFVFNTLVFLRAWCIKDNGIMDIAWGMSLLAANLIAMLWS